MNADFDIAIIGSGFSGSLLAMIARRLGHSVVMIERGSHPRFAIGESSTPLANLLLEQIATDYDLPRLRPLCEWGSWQRTYPQVACGLKRGFTFYHHNFDQPWELRGDRANQLLVAASPHDEVADTHWYRADFDHFLMQEARTLGVEYIDHTELTSAAPWNRGLRLDGTRHGSAVTLRARFVADASGSRGFLHRALKLPAAQFAHLPQTEGLFTHFGGVRRWDDLMPVSDAAYSVDDAAVHHVFPGGWIWVLRFNNGITSAGVAAATPNDFALNESNGWEGLLARLPAVRELFADAQLLMPFIHVEPLAFRSAAVAGANWALLPSAAGVVDPLLSSGFPLTLLGIQRLGRVLKDIDSAADQLKAYEAQTRWEIDIVEKLVGALYHNMTRPRVFNALTLLYFAAASFTETAHRLGKRELAGDAFLLGDHPVFAPAFHRCLDLALGHAETDALVKHVLTTISLVDVAGLGDLSRRNSYGVFASDLRSAAHKFGVTVQDIDAMLDRCGFVARQPDVP